MAGEMFCIDFGCSYTKVGLRTGFNSKTQLIAHPENTEGNEGFCFPSAALTDDRTPTRKYLFGAITGRDNLAQGITPRRNWKPDLFASPGAAPVVLEEGLEALLASADFDALVRRYRVPQQETEALRTLSRAVGMLAAKPTAPRTATPTPGPQADVFALAVGYFRFLREKVFETVGRRPVTIDPSAFPARVCVPAFNGDGVVSDATRNLFRSILTEAGWVSDPECPLITEPIANVLGVISDGENVVWEPRPRDPQVNIGRMFRHGPLIKAYRAKREAFSLLVCDLGSYTADFALVRFRTRDDPDARPSVWQQSVPLGIAALDERVRGALAPAKADWWANASGVRRERCRRTLYTNRKAYTTAEVGDIGTASEQPAIGECMNAFGAELARVFREFCDRHEIRTCDEVVLTGGGNHIPSLRNELLAAIAGRFNTGYIVRVPPGTPVRNDRAVLSPEQVRGGSAIGGCSVYFDTSNH
jgi:hypothetical protein